MSSKEYYQKNKEKILLSQKQKKSKRSPEDILREKEYHKKYSSNPEYKARRRQLMDNPVSKAKRKAYRIKWEHGITHEDYLVMLKAQNYTCLICKKEHSSLKDGLVIDHNHETGKVRGLLCPTCNSGIGLLKDSTLVLQSAINYLNIYK